MWSSGIVIMVNILTGQVCEYVNGTLYSLLASPVLRQMAKEIVSDSSLDENLLSHSPPFHALNPFTKEWIKKIKKEMQINKQFSIFDTGLSISL